MARTVLFSNPEIANFINENFEAVWQSVREVPVVSIDFGNGHSIKRTLNGNVASYVCLSNGQILDLLPGLYEPRAYKDRLEQLLLLHRYIESAADAKQKNRALVSYHQQQWQRLDAGKSPARFVKEDGKLKLSNKATDPVKKWTEPLNSEEAYKTVPLPKEELAQWQQLLDDVRFNETEMRKRIHAKLASENVIQHAPTVAFLSKWLFREVLHADLDDPYLGLKTVLDGSYPFDKVKKVGGQS